MNCERSINPAGRFILLKRCITFLLCHPITGKLIGYVFRNNIPHRGSLIKVPASGDPRVNAALFWGVYESAEIRFVRNYLDETLDVIELGSSLGGVSCYIAKKLSKERKLICVEANPEIISLLRQNIKLNAPDRNVRIIHGAISYEGSEIDFAINANSLSSRLGTDGMVKKVPSLTLSSILKIESLREFALVCDIEGAEAPLFDLDPEAFLNCRKIIIELHAVEYKDTSYDPDKLVSLIESKTSLHLFARYGNVCAFSAS